VVVRRSSLQTAALDTWPPADGDRRRWLRALATGEARLNPAACAALEAAGPGEILHNLQLDVDGALAITLDDRELYMAAAMWYKTARRKLFRALNTHAGFARRITGYGLYTLADPQQDPLTVWRPLGAWAFGTQAGWHAVERQLADSPGAAQAIDTVKARTAPWAQRYQVLVALAADYDRGDLIELLRLAETHGRFWQRIRARGALDELDRRLARRREQQAREAEARQQADAVVPLSNLTTHGPTDHGGV